MSTATWSTTDTERAQHFWAEYAATHNLSEQHGQAAGIDPANGHIWFGSSAAEIYRQLKQSGQQKPLFFVRVGYDTYLRKGGRR